MVSNIFTLFRPRLPGDSRPAGAWGHDCFPQVSFAPSSTSPSRGLQTRWEGALVLTEALVTPEWHHGVSFKVLNV